MHRKGFAVACLKLRIFHWMWAKCWVHVSDSIDWEDCTRSATHIKYTHKTKHSNLPSVHLLDGLAWISLSGLPLSASLFGWHCVRSSHLFGRRAQPGFVSFLEIKHFQFVHLFCFRNISNHQTRQHYHIITAWVAFIWLQYICLFVLYVPFTYFPLEG